MSEADEIVVLDTGSTDGTVPLLRELGATVYCETIDPWRFDTARNHALAHVPEETDILRFHRPGRSLSSRLAVKSWRRPGRVERSKQATAIPGILMNTATRVTFSGSTRFTPGTISPGKILCMKSYAIPGRRMPPRQRTGRSARPLCGSNEIEGSVSPAFGTLHKRRPGKRSQYALFGS